MLTERVTNLWLRFKMGLLTCDGELKNLVCWVIENFNAFNHDKKAMLTEIKDKFPNVFGEMTDNEFLEAFHGLSHSALCRNEILSPAELEWARECVKDPGILKKMEEIIFRHLLIASDYWDHLRHETVWTISEVKRMEIAREILFAGDIKMGAKRKMQLAQEFGLPDNKYAGVYFKKLLWDRCYDQAWDLAQLKGFVYIDAAVEVIVDNLNSMYIVDALEIAQRFLAGDPKVAEEIKKILERLQS